MERPKKRQNCLKLSGSSAKNLQFFSAANQATLIGWIDFDFNDTFDSNEAATTTVAASGTENGSKTLTWDSIPTDIAAGTSYVRLRLTTDTDIDANTPGGSADDGEVDDYQLSITGFDFGDAPDTYATDNTDDSGEGIGANHIVDSNLYIGPTVPDVDSDGFVDGSDDSTNAGDDDAAAAPGNGADEGGIILNALTTSDTSYSVDVDVFNNTGNDAYLVGWIDFDSSGVFDADEGVVFGSDRGTAGIQPIASNASIQNLTLDWTDIGGVGPDITNGTTYVRFRLSTDADVAGGGTNLTVNTPGGAASDGEVEDYQLIISDLTLDFGDAPDSYGTDNTDDGGEGVGPNHMIVNGIHMGSNAPDTDSDGFGDGTDDQGNATDDDLEGTRPDDEDGVTTFPALADTTTSYSIDATVTNDTGDAANLIGWIDFDRNGAFDIDEAATVTVAASGAENGTKTLTWSIIPSDITTGISYARFRLTTDAAITTGTPGGQADDGEVEDYQLTIATGCAVTLKPPKDENIPAGGTIIYNHSVANPTGSTAFIRIDLVSPSPSLSYTFFANSDNTWFIDGGNGIVEGGGVGDDVFITKGTSASFGAVFVQLTSDAATNFNIEVEAPGSVTVGTIDTVDFRSVLDVDGDFSNTADQCTGDVTNVTTVAEGDCNVTISPPFSGQISPGGSMVYTHTVFNGSDFTGFVRIDLIATNPTLTYSFIAEGASWQLVGSNGDAETPDTFLTEGELEAFGSVFVHLKSQESVNFRVHVKAASSVSMSTVEQVNMRAFMDLDGDYDGTTDDQCEGMVTDVTSVSEGYLKLDKDASVADTHTFDSTDGSCSVGSDGVTDGPCDTITYTLTYKNLGVQNAIDLIVTDQIPDHTTYVGVTVEFDSEGNL